MRSTYGRHAFRRTSPSPVTYGFCVGLMSIAQPYACWEKPLVWPVTGRQLNDALTFFVLNQSEGRGGRHAAASAIFWIGNPASKIWWNTESTSSATDSLMMSGPCFTRPPNVQ